MDRRSWRGFVVPLIALSLALVAVTALSAGLHQPAQAQGGTDIVRVAESGTDSVGCGDAITPCATIQYAIDEAFPGDEVRVAQGTYTGAQALVAVSPDGPYTYTQVALITKTLTLRGGYATTDWTTSVPTQNLTIIDAEGYGRGVSVVGTGSQSATIEGFTITGGDYDGLGNPPGEAWIACGGTGTDCGGGLLARNVVIILRSLVISGNSAGGIGRTSEGGGAYLYEVKAGSRIEDSLFYTNTALGDNAGGGGLIVEADGDVDIVRTQFVDNYAEDEGGGMRVAVDYGLAVIDDCEFTENRVTGPNGDGGGLAVLAGNYLLKRNTFSGNAAEQGGGLTVRTGNRNATLEGNTFISNTARNCGGALRLEYGRKYTVTNNLFARNGGAWAGAACIFHDASSTWLHNTLVENTEDGAYVGMWLSGYGTAITLVNNIIVSHTVAIEVNEGVSLTADHTLFFGNGDDIDVDAGGTAVSTNEITGSVPLFVDPDAEDFHLLAGSPAIDAGAETDVRRDIDGDWRPDNCAWDIGADEVVTGAKCWKAYLPLVMR